MDNDEDVDTELEVETLKIQQYIVVLQKSISLYRYYLFILSQLNYDFKKLINQDFSCVPGGT